MLLFKAAEQRRAFVSGVCNFIMIKEGRFLALLLSLKVVISCRDIKFGIVFSCLFYVFVFLLYILFFNTLLFVYRVYLFLFEWEFYEEAMWVVFCCMFGIQSRVRYGSFSCLLEEGMKVIFFFVQGQECFGYFFVCKIF